MSKGQKLKAQSDPLYNCELIPAYEIGLNLNVELYAKVDLKEMGTLARKTGKPIFWMKDPEACPRVPSGHPLYAMWYEGIWVLSHGHKEAKQC